MSSTDNLERAQRFRRTVPVVTGEFDTVRAREFIGPLEDPLMPRAQPEMSVRRMWALAGVIALASSVSFGAAFAGRDSGPAPLRPCRLVAASEVAKNVVEFQLDRPAGNEKVLLGYFTGAMEAHPTPGTAPDAASYTVDTAGYFHNELIGAYIGGVLCNGRVDLGGVRPGDERFFAASS